MKKVKLDLDAISVDTFEVTQAEGGRGTVRGHLCCVCCCDPCCCTCCNTCQATCPDSCQTCPESCWGTCYDVTCQGRSCDYCITDVCTYQVYAVQAGGDAAMMLPCY